MKLAKTTMLSVFCYMNCVETEVVISDELETRIVLRITANANMLTGQQHIDISMFHD